MSVESGNILKVSEIRSFADLNRKLWATHVVDFFKDVNKDFPETNICLGMDGELGKRYPVVALEGVWKDWEVLTEGSKKLITTRHAISVGYTTDGPLVTVTGMYKSRIGEDLTDEGSHTRRVKQRIVDSFPILEIVEKEIEGAQLLNPNGEEIDVLKLRKKAHELLFKGEVRKISE